MNEIERLHGQLNAKGVIDETWYRRNHLGYELLTYINHLVAIYCSGNYNALPIFVSRAQMCLEQEKCKNLSGEYLSLVRQYLQAVATFAAQHPQVSANAMAFIPASLAVRAQPAVQADVAYKAMPRRLT